MREAEKKTQPAPKTLEESQALYASLLLDNENLKRLNRQQEALIASQSEALDASILERNKLLTEIDEQTRTIDRLLGKYAKRQERIEQPRPLLDMLEDEQEDEATLEAVVEVERDLDELQQSLPGPKRRPKKKRSYGLPNHWPRVQVEYVEDNPNRNTCPEHGEREIMGYETREKAVMKPAQFYVEVTQVPKYKCKNHPECGISQQPAPEGLVKGDKIDTSIAVQIAVQKHMFHVPLYRSEDIFASSGWEVSRSTLHNILCSLAYLLEGLYDYLREKLAREAKLIGVDDTVVTLILPDYIPPPNPGNKWSERISEVLTKAREKEQGSVSARMWAYQGDESCPWNIFDFTVSRHRDGPERILKDFKGGTLLGDCYAGYESLRIERNSEFRLAACNAHARRKIYEAQKDHPKESAILLAIYRELYELERMLKQTPGMDILAKRQEIGVSLFARMKEQVERMQSGGSVLPKSKLGKALKYVTNNWDELTTYLSDANCPIDNNACEQLMKHTATGRKNWLFVGSMEGGYRSAILTTICSSAHRHNLDVYAYMKDIADRLLLGDRDYESMQPENWAKTHPESIRIYREEESRYAAERKAKSLSNRRRELAKRKAKK